MNRSITLFLCLIPFTQATFPAMDCLSTSKKLQESFDNKEYAPVACTCPCDQHQAKGLHSQNRNQCLECGHYHYPKPQIFLSEKQPQPSKKSLRPLSPRIALKELVAKYRKRPAA